MTRSADFQAYVAQIRAEVDSALDQVLPVPPECPPLVAQAMRYSIQAGGKRVRPVLTIASAEAVGRANGVRSAEELREIRDLAMPAACAIEMIHTYSLVHDDLPAMDNDSVRRGRPTLHVLYGDALAILAGDGLLAEAFALLANQPCSSAAPPDLAERRLRVIQQIGRTVGGAGMVAGQAIDLECAGLVKDPSGDRSVQALDVDGLRDMHARKTGMLFRASGVSGAIMACGRAEQIAAIDRFAGGVGLVFQIVDDILDVRGTSAQLGKTPGKDHAAGKVTYPSLFGLEQSRSLAAQCTREALDALNAGGLETGRLRDFAHWLLERDA